MITSSISGEGKSFFSCNFGMSLALMNKKVILVGLDIRSPKLAEYLNIKNKNIETTLELVEVIKTAVPMKFRIEKHPARQIFQAIRIEVNHELDVIEPALSQALSLIEVGGRVSVITFHSLEDKIVKKYFKEKCDIDPKIKGMPNIPDEYLPDFKLVVNKAILPTEEELKNNPRARSAKLRVIERIK